MRGFEQWNRKEAEAPSRFESTEEFDEYRRETDHGQKQTN
jgi:rRNA maturation protein Nop10